MLGLKANVLTILILLPALGGLLVLFARTRDAARKTGVAVSVATFVLSLSLLLPGMFDWKAGSTYAYLDQPIESSVAGGTVQLVSQANWIPAFHIQYKVGIDGLSLPLVILSTFIAVLAAIASWNVERMPRGYWALFLLLQSGILGVFLALDFFLFYVFFELSLLPMYFLIGIWGGPRKEYAAIKFFLYTLVGSIALLIVLIGVCLHIGSFDLIALPQLIRQHGVENPDFLGLGQVFFALLMLGFLIKVPSVPFHTWLPDAHVEAPTPISMILAAVLLKMGGYGIFRVAYPLFPDAAKALWLPVAILGVVSIIYGALCAMSQTDFKKLVAYSSVSHMGFVVLGAGVMTVTSINGSLFMMIAHGLISAMLFFVVGVVYDRAHHREMARLGGLAGTMPVYTGFSTIACFANLGMPGLAGFIGEVMVLLGTFQAARKDSILYQKFAAIGPVALRNYTTAVYALAIIACLGIVLTAGYMLWTVQRVFLGRARPEQRGFPEVTGREVLVLTPLTVMIVLLGILPAIFVFAFTDRTVAALYRLFS